MMNTRMNRTKIFGLSLTALALLALGGCGEKRDTSNQDSLNTQGFYARFDPANDIIPFPNNLLFNGSTDGTLNITDSTDFNDPQVALSTLDGFSTVAPITAQFSSSIDSATLIGGETVRLFEVTLSGVGGAVTGITTELVVGTDYAITLSPVDSSNSTISIQPLRPLSPSSSYLVTFSRGISDTMGNAANPELSYALAKGDTALEIGGVSQFTALTDAQAVALEPLRQLTNIAEDAVVAFTITSDEADGTDDVIDLAASDIVLSWSFTTQSIGNVLSTVWAGTAAGVVVTADSGMTTSDVEASLPGVADIHIGTLDLPYYLAAPSIDAPAAPLSEYWKNSDSSFLTPLNNTPVATSTQTVPLLMTVPNIGTMPTTGWPLVIFQHGITENRSNLLAIADTLATAGFAAVAIDLPLHGITDKTSPLYVAIGERTFDLDLVDNTSGDSISDGVIDESGKHYLNFNNLLVGRDNLRQGIVDLMTLHANLSGLPNLDTTQVFFVGHSLGAMSGIPFLSLEAGVQDAVLAMPGGGIPRLLDGSVNYGPEMEATLAAAGVIKGSADYESFLTTAQTVLDSADPINYATSVGNNRGLLLFEVVGGNSSPPDQTIPNTLWPYASTGTSPNPLAGTEPLADSLGLVKVDVADPATTSGTDLQAWVQFNAGHHGSLLTPNDAAGNADVLSAQVTTEMQTQMATFLATGGASVGVTDTTLIAAPPTETTLIATP